MLYKNYNVTAEVQSYDIWDLDKDGNLLDWQSESDGFEVTGYHFFKGETDTEKGDDFFQAMSESDAQTLEQLIDDRIEDLKKPGGTRYETMQQSGHSHVESLGDGLHVLENPDGIYEYWQANRNHASYGIRYKNTHLEYCSMANDYTPNKGVKNG